MLETLLVGDRRLEVVRLFDRRHRRADHRLGKLRVGARQGRILAGGAQEEDPELLVLHGEGERHGGARGNRDVLALPPHSLVLVERIGCHVFD